jgi:hypothetical protein
MLRQTCLQGEVPISFETLGRGVQTHLYRCSWFLNVILLRKDVGAESDGWREDGQMGCTTRAILGPVYILARLYTRPSNRYLAGARELWPNHDLSVQLKNLEKQRGSVLSVGTWILTAQIIS